MLAAALFFVCVIGLCAGAVLEGSLAFARVSARHAATQYVQSALGEARAQLVVGLAAEIAAGTRTLQAPAPLAAASACATTCPFTRSATYALAGDIGDAGSPNEIATNVQPLAAIGEGRVAATIVATIASANGTPLAVRTEFVTLRTFGVPPYVAIDGLTDAAAARDVPYEADAGGCDPTQPSQCDTANAGAGATPAPAGSMNPGDTRIHALSQCIDNGSGQCAGQPYLDADPPNASGQTSWYNANAQNDGWSR